MKNAFRSMVVLVASVLSACGGGGGSSGSAGAPNTAPTANFAFSCTDLLCTFTSTSTDQDVGDGIASYSWSFGDSTPADTRAAPTHTFAAASTYSVSLTVTDRTGAVSTPKVIPVTVSAPAAPAAPHALFTSACVSLDCNFTDASFGDAGSTIQSWSWDFGDGTPPVTTRSPSHRYAATALTTYTVKLTVSDNAAKTSTSVQTVVVAPAASTVGLRLTTASKVTATIVSHSCSANGNKVVITSPINETIFSDGCVNAVGVPVTVNGGAAFAADTVLQVEVLSGIVPSTTLLFTPTIRVTGDFASGWTLTFDDGYGGPGEPDFNDLVILIKASP